MNSNFFNLIKNSPQGRIVPERTLFVKIPGREIQQDYNGNKITVDYMCSLIICVHKYDDRRVDFTIVDLPSTFTGTKKEYKDARDQEYQHTGPMSIIKISSLKISDDYNDFK